MRIPRIYLAANLTIGQTIELEKSAAHHIARVLRMDSQQDIILFNGEDGEYRATLSMQGKSVFAAINNFVERNTESHLHITLLQGISKGDRMDICIQKAVELGVQKIVPVICQRTVVNIKGERNEKKHQHWQGIVINACEQSGRTRVPELSESIKFKDIISQPDKGLKITLSPDAKTSLPRLSAADQHITLLIGPEGGLDANEILLATQHGFQPVRMGPRILRTETAAITAIAALQTLYGDLG